MMSKLKALCIGILCLCLFHPAGAEEDIWTEGVLEIRGHIIDVHAIVDDAMPETLEQITLMGNAMTKRELYQALADHFLLHPDFRQRNSTLSNHAYICMWASGYSGIAGYDDQLITNCEVEQLVPVDDPELCRLYENCTSFLADYGITVTENTGYICQAEQRGEEFTIALLPYQIEGLSTEYKSMIVNREYLQPNSPTEQHILDYPWAEFVFDAQGRLVKAALTMAEAADSKALSGEAIPWEQAAENVLDAVIASYVDLNQLLEEQSDYDEDQFWQDYRVQLSRVLPMWMPDWYNVCQPGWCIQYQLYDAQTGDFLYAISFCANALTGEVPY